MELNVTKIDGANAKIEAVVVKEDIESKVEKIAKSLSKTANIAGFRKGKVPVKIIKQMYGEKLVQDAEGEALREALDSGIKELSIESENLIGEPSVTKYDKKESGDIEVEIKVATKPQIELEGYKDLVDEFEKPTVSDEEVEERLEQIAKANAEYVENNKRKKAKDGDMVNIDFEGFLDGEPFAGGKAEGYDLKLGSGSFIPGFEEQIAGMEKGEEKTIKVTFPENYGNADLAGKETEFKVKLNVIKDEKIPEINDEFAKKMTADDEMTLEKYKEKLKEQLAGEKLAKLYNEEKKPELLEKLVEKYEFDLPEFLVEQEIDMLVNQKARELSDEELQELRENQEKLKEFREKFRDDAVKSVKATFIIDALAKSEGISVGEQEMMSTIYMEALQSGQDPSKLYKTYQENGYLPAIQMAITEDKVLKSLLDSKMKEA